MARTARRLEVALFGFYGYGNFGDDLAAAIFCRHLQRLGVGVRVFCLCRPYAKAFGLTVADNLDQLLRGVDMVLFGGGGVLVSHRRPSWLQGKMLTNLSQLAHTCQRLIDIARLLQIPVYGLSIGSDGVVGRSLFPLHKRAFLETVRFISVRNRSDLAVLRYHGREGQYYPDIIWQTASFFPAKPRRRGRITVGVNLYLSNLLGAGILYVASLWMITRRHKDVDFIFIDTANASQNRFGAIALPASPNISRYMFCNPMDDLAMLSSLDLVISTRLHLGVAGMSYGVPFVSVKAEAKTRVLMHEVGQAQMCFGVANIARFTKLLWSRNRLQYLLDNYARPDLQELKMASAGHLHELTRIIASTRKGIH